MVTLNLVISLAITFCFSSILSETELVYVPMTLMAFFTSAQSWDDREVNFILRIISALIYATSLAAIVFYAIYKFTPMT